ncbi:unnamed protein product [Urochloa decumbens]|uniref:Protein kinase domain-containing protein n=1 Tax=Urochloa decumbens TaxID=240449 RepID=A0ABC9AUK3_9POAL
MKQSSPPVLLLVVTAFTAVLLAAATAPPPMGLPGCPTSCGTVTVPYPFGIGANCSLPGFNLTCDDHAFDPPRLFLGASTDRVQITNISLGHVSVRVVLDDTVIVNRTTKSIPDPVVEEGSAFGSFRWGFLGGRSDDDDRRAGPLVYSYHLNKFFVIGCKIEATLHRRSDAENDPLITGCSAFCSVGSQHKGWAHGAAGGCHKCHGNGCCMAAITSFYPFYIVRTRGLDVGDVDPRIQNLVVIGEAEWMERVWCRMIGGKQLPEAVEAGAQQAAPPEDLSMVPVMLEWAMDSTPASTDNTTRCPKDGASSACKSKHSSCKEVHSPFHRGYACQCLPGFHGNPYLTDGCQGLSIALGAGSAAVVLILALGIIITIRKIKEKRIQKQRQRFFKQNRGQLLQQLVCQRVDIAERMIVTEEELEKATNNFDKSRELGGGGHGIVYKGILSSQHVVAIKKSKIVIQKEIIEFINEVAILSQVNHRNIVKLIGCCLETEVPLLVYEFISNGTLYNHLHVEASVSLSWKDRLRVAVETARALTYLHSLASTPVIHRDIKSPNILLNDMLTVKLSDFGASRYIPIDQEGMDTTVQGTLGYLDPMYHTTGHLTDKSDVYSFGVLLIELLTRKKPTSYRSSQGFGLVSHFVGLFSQGNLDQILDPQVAREGDGEVADIALLAQTCVKFSSEERPTMREVEIMLESIQAAKEFSSDTTDDDRSSEELVLSIIGFPVSSRPERQAFLSLDKLMIVASHGVRCIHEGMASVFAMQMPNNHCHRPSSSTNSITQVLLAAVATVLLALHLAAAEPPMGLPGCPTICGNVSVPYPFGIGANCSLPSFDLTCDATHSPPRLLLGDGAAAGVEVTVTGIFLQNATMRVISHAIINQTSHVAAANGTWRLVSAAGPFVLSYNHNNFVALGCAVQATLLSDDKSFISRCYASCWGNTDHKEQPTGNRLCRECSGHSCCQAFIPIYSPSYDASLIRLDDPTGTDGLLPTVVMYIAEKGWIDDVWCRIMAVSLGNGSKFFPIDPPPELLSAVPVILEWAMNSVWPTQTGLADMTSRCPTNRASSACISNHSNCIDMNSIFRSGYACKCSRGYYGNPYLSDGCQDLSIGPSSQKRKGLSIGLGVGSGAALLVLGLGTIVLVRKVKLQRKKRLRQKYFKQNRGQLLQQLLVCQRADIAERMIVTEEELEKATNNFDKSRELGGGGHGIVYKGILSSQHVVAIKKSKIVIQKEIIEFINEVAILSQVNHRNIVKLIGCCLETEVPLLVYEFISNGTLYSHLHVEASISLSWKDRLRVAVETARALTYLHSLASTPVIHRDIKSPNILLDDMLTVKLSDFGASRYISVDLKGLDTTVQGTLGYLDPTYHTTGHLTDKSDVYSFGVLLIELLTRKKPTSYRSSQGFSLVSHFVGLLSQGNLDQILDPQVAREGDGEIVDIALLAQMCVKSSSEKRPTMRQVEILLESIQAAKEFSSDVTDDDRSSGGNNLEVRSCD